PGGTVVLVVVVAAPGAPGFGAAPGAGAGAAVVAGARATVVVGMSVRTRSSSRFVVVGGVAGGGV
ncbi:MAG: hypothetical protein M3163_06475, partial [Actinomycetota bacterium]|nr:hypothetical protein [Actinomycetota bacterium]